MMGKRAVLFLNGTIFSQKALQAELQGVELCVCADGGAVHAHALQIPPTAVIGDFDSLPKWLQNEYSQNGEVELQRYPVDKDQTDLELCLDYLIHKGVTELLVVGALGGRFDQTLMNIFTLSREKYCFDSCVLYDGKARAVLLVGKSEAVLSAKHGDTFSLLALSSQVEGVCVRGARWELFGEPLCLGEGRGISNQFRNENEDVSISLESGKLLVIQE